MHYNIYLASPFFNEEENQNLSRAEEILRSRGLTVYSPREQEDREERGTSAWSRAVFREDCEAINQCDLVVLMYYGAYSDSGTAWECGYSYAVHKPVIVVHVHGDTSNLMVHEGCHTNLDGIEALVTYDFETMPRSEYHGKMF